MTITSTIKRSARLTATVATLVAGVCVVAPSASAADDIGMAPYDVAGMARAIESRLGSVTGWSYAIAKDGRLAASNADGQARTAADGAVPMTTTSKMEIWSVTKTYTAAATLELLEAHPQASVSSPVAPYLPAGWFRGAGFGATMPLDQRVTFAQLLGHTSGLGQVKDGLTPLERSLGLYNKRWAGVQYAVAKGTSAPASYNYDNMNYALLRVLNARLARDLNPAIPVQNASNTGTINLAVINARLLQPAGINPTSCVAANPSSAVLHYNAATPAQSGVLVQLTGPDNEECAGHRGLHLSAIDMLRFMVHLRHGSIVSEAVRTMMDSNQFGWNQNSNSNASGVYWHGGDGFVGGREGHTCHMKFPNNIEATLIINSSLTGVNASQCGLLRQSWQNPA